MNEQRPDPAKDYIGALAWMMDRLETAERALAAVEGIQRVLGEKRVNASEMARDLGYAVSFLYQPWRMPGFGREGTMFPRSVWLAWLARPESERREEWDNLPAAERAKIRSARAKPEVAADGTRQRRTA